MALSAIHSPYEAITVIGWLVVLAIVVAAAVLLWRGAIVAGACLAVLAVVAAVLLL